MNPKILLLTILGLALANAWFSKSRVSLSSCGDFFMLAWLYYGFAVAGDLLLGWELHALPGATDFSDPESQSLACQALWLYLSCGATFMLAYAFTRREQWAPRQESFPIVMPPVWLLVGLNLAALTLFSEEYFQMSRQERGTLLHGSTWSKLPLVAITAIKATDVLYIMVQPRVRNCLAVAAAAILLGLVSGDRSDMALIAVCFLLKRRVELPRTVFLGLAAGGLLALAAFKTLYTQALEYYALGYYGGGVELDSMLSLSAIDGYSSFLILATYLEQECPFWLGASYVKTTLWMTLPSDLRGEDVMTLASDFAWTYFPDKAARGGGTGFSAVAEAYLNFGLFGPAALGAVWGWSAKQFDTRRRGIAFYVFALMTCRLFRTDFASLWKSWVVLFGGSMLIVYVLLRLLYRNRTSQRARLRPAQPLTWSPSR